MASISSLLPDYYRKLKYHETVVTGIDRAAEAFLDLFTGTNVGKMVVKLDE